MHTTSSHALLQVLAGNGVDRIFLVPGESYLGLLDALRDFPGIDVVTCRHEGGAGFMAVADGRLTRRPGVLMVSRGPGACNAAIALHTAQQDAVPLILLVGQVPRRDLRREAFQEIDYGQMFGRIAKWVAEPTGPEQLAEVAFKALRIAMSGTPGPVVIVVPEDIQQQAVAEPGAGAGHAWTLPEPIPTLLDPAALSHVLDLLGQARRPLLIAGGAFEAPGGREALQAFAEAWQLPVAVSFRRQDVMDGRHPLYVGELGLANPAAQLQALQDSDLVLALGTRLGDITSQGYTFPHHPRPTQALVHCHPDPHVVGLNVTPQLGLVCDPVALVRALTPDIRPHPQGSAWVTHLRTLQALHATRTAWPEPLPQADDGIPFITVVQALQRHAPPHTTICLDAGTFAAPVYRHFAFSGPQRLMAPLSGAMGYGVPAAVATQLRCPERRVVCLVGDGGFLMTGHELMAAVERRLPLVVILSNNRSYGSIRVHQERTYPRGGDGDARGPHRGPHRGTTLSNPDFTALATAFGLQSLRLSDTRDVDAAIATAMQATGPVFIEVTSSLDSDLPRNLDQDNKA